MAHMKNGSLELATRFFLAVMVLGILGFALVIVLGNLFASANPALPAISRGTIVNETTTTINGTGSPLSVSNLNAVACTILVITNATGTGIVYNLNNFTITNCLIANTTSTTDVNITIVNVTFSYSDKNPAAVNALSNLTAGAESFFSNANSWFTLLSVIIIIAIIVVVISVVRTVGRGKEDI